MHKLFLPVICALILAACATARVDPQKMQNAVDSLDEAVFEGRKAPESALNAYEALYKKYPKDPIAVGAYADALRRSGEAQEASYLLRPFIAKTDMNNLPGPIFMAYIRLMIDQGYFRDAETRLRKRMMMPASKLNGATSTAQISNLLGVTLASQNRKVEAEQAFTMALKNWDGRPGIVERNLEQLKQSAVR